MRLWVVLLSTRRGTEGDRGTRRTYAHCDVCNLEKGKYVFFHKSPAVNHPHVFLSNNGSALSIIYYLFFSLVPSLLTSKARI